MLDLMKRFAKDGWGTTSLEYGLIAVGIFVGIIMAVVSALPDRNGHCEGPNPKGSCSGLGRRMANSHALDELCAANQSRRTGEGRQVLFTFTAARWWRRPGIAWLQTISQSSRQPAVNSGAPRERQAATDGHTMIALGLAEDDRVVVNGQYKLRQNSKVTLPAPAVARQATAS
jgi:Flp pilus assembly pilin Flp